MKSKYITPEAILRNVISSSNIERTYKMRYYASVKFSGSSMKYTYVTTLSKLKRGDYVLLDSSNGLGVGKVISYVSTNHISENMQYSWILCKLDLELLRVKLNESRNR